ncbi:32771_t:CDS:2, partial [Gigaspora margarita]
MVSGYYKFTYQETKSSSAIPRIWGTYVYNDGIMLVRIIRRDNNNNSAVFVNSVCLQQLLSFRLIYPNGTVSERDIDLKIQSFNYCLTQTATVNLEPMRLYPLQTGYFLVKYFNATNIDDFSTYEEWIMIINWNGEILSKTFLGYAYTNPVSGTWDPNQSNIIVNISPEKGFLHFFMIRNTTNIAWAQYFIDSSHQFQKLSNGTFETLFLNSMQTIATVDGGYAFIYTKSYDATDSNDPRIIRAALYFQTIGYGDETLGPSLLLYQVSIQNISLNLLSCGIFPVSGRQICTLAMVQTYATNDTTNGKQPNNAYHAKISFLSSGSVIEFTSISEPLIDPNITKWQMTSLPYGGYLFISRTISPTYVNIYVYAFDEYSNTWQPWDLPEPTTSNVGGTYQILSNNSIIVAQLESLNTWSYLISDLPKFTNNMDNGYSNIQSHEEPFADSVSGLLRLTLEGTAYYENLNSSGKYEFFSNLQDEISKFLSVSPSRLSSNKHVQVDFSIISGRQILLSFNIEQTKIKTERSVASLIQDLNTMIMNKDITPIGSGNTVKYLDETYGFVPSLALFLLARRRYKKGQNITILQLSLILFDLIADILFLVNNGKDVEFLYIPRYDKISATIQHESSLNTFMIIKKENTRPEFFSWFVQNVKVASIFTILAGSDIEVLAILKSNLAGFAFFQAPFSDEAESKIFWGACLNIFTEDIPQLFIQ